ncbi:MAG: hypothetical protein IPK52_19985 [Chloroflexi bacterium]|nr:hypothetical protein [Chloroflexota bacterium]
MNKLFRRNTVVVLVLIVALLPLSGLASAVTGGVIPVYFHVIRRGTTTAQTPITLSFSIEDVGQIGDGPFTYVLVGNSAGGDGLTVHVSAANGTGKTMSAVLLGSRLESGVYSWYAVTTYPDGQTVTSPQALLTVR